MPPREKASGPGGPQGAAKLPLLVQAEKFSVHGSQPTAIVFLVRDVSLTVTDGNVMLVLLSSSGSDLGCCSRYGQASHPQH